jgi:hypothetical protein
MRNGTTRAGRGASAWFCPRNRVRRHGPPRPPSRDSPAHASLHRHSHRRARVRPGAEAGPGPDRDAERDRLARRKARTKPSAGGSETVPHGSFTPAPAPPGEAACRRRRSIQGHLFPYKQPTFRGGWRRREQRFPDTRSRAGDPTGWPEPKRSAVHREAVARFCNHERTVVMSAVVWLGSTPALPGVRLDAEARGRLLGPVSARSNPHPLGRRARDRPLDAARALMPDTSAVDRWCRCVEPRRL